MTISLSACNFTSARTRNGDSVGSKIAGFFDNLRAATQNLQGDAEIASDEALKAHFIDVGQGDAVFIELPNDETMLIDAGPDADTAADYIKSLGYDSVNYVVATHPDADHITGMAEVLDAFDVGRFYMPEKEHTTQTFERMLDALADNGCEAVYASAGIEIINTSELKAYFVGPTKIYSDNNNCSAVVKIEYKETAFLFAGDAETSEENDMIESGYDLRADILKAAHHGSASSTSRAFVDAVGAKAAVISVGANNGYGHPTTEVLNTLKNAGVKIYRTDKDGTVIITTDGEGFTVDTEN